MDIKAIAQKAKDVVESPNGRLATSVAVTATAIAATALVIKAINNDSK